MDVEQAHAELARVAAGERTRSMSSTTGASPSDAARSGTRYTRRSPGVTASDVSVSSPRRTSTACAPACVTG
jgi:hypothetical protein